MKKFLSVLALGLAAVSVSAQVTYDFEPKVESIFFQELIETTDEGDEFVSEARINVKFDEDVWWVGGFSKQCYLLDKDGNKLEVYNGWHPDFGGTTSDYSAMYFGVRGLNKYEDADYTLVIPEGLLGNTTWSSSSHESGKSNPELKYDFNVWKLAGQPREDKTTYDFTPVATSQSVEEVRINGKKYLELQLGLEFSEPVAIHKSINDKWSVYNDKDERLQEAVLRAFVDENNPNKAIIGLRGVDLKSSVDYTISVWMAGFGTLEWEKEDYCESHASPELIFKVNPVGNAVESVSVAENDAPVFNLQGVRVNSDNLQKGIYIRDGKKFIVK